MPSTMIKSVLLSMIELMFCSIIKFYTDKMTLLFNNRKTAVTAAAVAAAAVAAAAAVVVVKAVL